MRSKKFIMLTSSISVILALFLFCYIFYSLVAISSSYGNDSQNNPNIPNSNKERLFEISFAGGLYNVEGNVITLTNPDLPITTIFLIFTDLTNLNNPKDVNFEIVFEPNIDFTVRDTKVSFKYLEMCEMKVKIVVENKNYTQIESFLIKA